MLFQMKRTIKLVYGILLCGLGTSSYGQQANYNYKQEIVGITDQWHNIILPNEVFAEVTSNLSDLRIYGLTANNDTVEAPYLLRLTDEKMEEKEVVFNTINVAHNDEGHFFTFEVPTEESVNHIELDFEEKNFDWRITLEGSQNQTEWYKLAENERLLSIVNEQTDFQFTKVTFPGSKYRFFRLWIHNSEKSTLRKASITLRESTEGKYRTYPHKPIKISENKERKRTEIHLEMQLPVLVNQIKIAVADTLDYYRPVTVYYVTDSIQTEQGWKYNYRTLTSGNLNSLEENELRCPGTIVQKLKISINNHDNRPLTIDSLAVKGYLHELVARFDDEATYFLCYGNSEAYPANYDIARFADNIPSVLTSLELGEAEAIQKEQQTAATPLFKNKAWLWAIMGVIIVLLGGFSINMIRKK
jgi:hypothetical protein